MLLAAPHHIFHSSNLNAYYITCRHGHELALLALLVALRLTIQTVRVYSQTNAQVQIRKHILNKYCISGLIYYVGSQFNAKSYLPSHYIQVTQFQYILTISTLRQTKQALIYVNLHISQRGCVLINIFCAHANV